MTVAELKADLAAFDENLPVLTGDELDISKVETKTVDNEICVVIE